MKIGIDGRLWNETGVGRYIRNIVLELAKQDSQDLYVIFLMDRDFDTITLPSNFKKVKANMQWHSIVEQTVLPIMYLREHLDLLFVPHFNVPIFYPKKFVVTIHDLTVLRVRTGRVTTLPYPIYLVKYIGAFIAYFVAVKRSRKIFTVSEFVKNDIVRTFGVDPQKIRITPNAVDDSFYKRSNEEIDRALQKYKIRKPYLFYVGNAHPHKNLERLIKAFELLLYHPDISQDRSDLSLVLGGKKNFFYERLENECKNFKTYDRLVFTGFIKDADLPALYCGAEAFVNPSLYEGFGIQILEAFACECRVICSNTTSLPEIGGDLADYFNPYDVQNIADVIKSVLKDEGSRLRPNKISDDTKNYSWEKSARVVLDTIRNL